MHLRNTNGTNQIKVVTSSPNPAFVNGENRWVAMSYDGSSSASGVKIYINNTLQNTTTSSDTLTSFITYPINLSIGLNEDRDEFNGTITNITIYDKVMDRTESKHHTPTHVEGFDKVQKFTSNYSYTFSTLFYNKKQFDRTKWR